MPRCPRDDAPGAAHHVMVRGIERRAIFLDDHDRLDFLNRLSQLVPELGFRCFGWALMPNHVHLVIRSGRARISQLMARLGTGYARRFNERYGRAGHLFQNRFRSRLVTDDADLHGLVLYVLRNPLEGGVVSDAAALERFPWCGLGALLGDRRPWPFEAAHEALALFGDDPTHAREMLRNQLGSFRGLDEAPAPPAPTRVARAPSTGFDALCDEVSARRALALGELRSRQRTRRIAAARREIAARAVSELGMSASEVARRMGLTSAAVSLMLARRSDLRGTT